ncbi:putative ATP-dependent RNA helicase DHX57 isoform X1 [Lampetra planeri]
MTSANQEHVKELLRVLQGQEPETEDSDYEEDESRGDEEYWEADQELLVEDVVNHCESPRPEPISQAQVSPFAVHNLTRYGFDRSRCEATLRRCDGDIGASLELLLTQCFQERFPGSFNYANADISLDDCLEQRKEEAFALESIFGSNFIERIPNRVWLVSLELSFLTDKLKNKAPHQMQRADERLKEDAGPVCRFYLRGGGCRFGTRCRQRHVAPTADGTSGGKSSIAEPPQSMYQLEIRFPANNRYPCVAPLVAFVSSNVLLPASFCLYASELLYAEAGALAAERLPAVFTLAMLLQENEARVTELLKRAEHSFSLPAPQLAPIKMPQPASVVKAPPQSAIASRAPRPREELEPRPQSETLPWRQRPWETRAANAIDPVDQTRGKKPSIQNGPGERARDDKRGNRNGPRDCVRGTAQGPTMTPPPAVSSRDGAEEDGDDASTVGVEPESYVRLKQRQQERKRRDRRQQDTLAQNAKLCRQYREKMSSRQYQSMLQERSKLPAWEERELILELLQLHQVLVVSGMTGCGKTTQVPQFVLDASLQGSPANVCNLVCTQPRRISAISVAERVARERAERLGASVGYQIRLESVQSSATRLLYCTTGVLLRRLEGDPMLQGVTHVLVDEVHERTEESDFLLMVLKDLIAQRSDLRVVLMSATLNAQLFSEYLYGCPVVHIPGRTFPVDQYFLEDIIDLTGYIIEHGSPFMRPAVRGGPDGGKGKGASASGAGGRRGKGGGILGQLEEELSRSLTLSPRNAVPVKEKAPDHTLSIQQLHSRYIECRISTIKTLAAMDLEKINLDLIEELLEWILEGKHDYKPGAVLIFMPGFGEIKTLFEKLQTNPMFNNRRGNRALLLPLHSSLSSEEQQAVFKAPPEGVIKIIISTNIAETSITIDDVVYVIDCGKMKEKRYDAGKGMESLEETWVSKANAVQRRGRAGRVASGACFHLFTSHRFEHLLDEQQLPEIQRVPLEQLCLRIKMLDLFKDRQLDSVFSRLIEPPAPESLTAAIQRLRDLGALTEEESLTPLGYHLASLPVDVRIGKLVLFGAIFRCLDPILTIAASLAFKSPFVSPWDKRQEANAKKLEFAEAKSDHLTLLKAYKGWLAAMRDRVHEGHHFCRENFLSWRTLQEISSLKRQFAELLSDIGFVREGLRARDMERAARHGGDGVLETTGPESNSNADNLKLVGAMLCAALYPNVVQVTVPEGKFQQTSTGAMRMPSKSEELRFITKSDGPVHIHPSSVNFQVRYFESPYLVYHEKVKTTRVYVRDCSMVSVYPLLLFAGGQVDVQLHKGQFLVSLDDGWIRFAATSQQVAELVRELKQELDLLLQDKIKNPTMDLSTCPRGSRIIDTIVHLITTQ